MIVGAGVGLPAPDTTNGARSGLCMDCWLLRAREGVGAHMPVHPVSTATVEKGKRVGPSAERLRSG